MRTQIHVEHANCTFCLAAARTELLAHPLVHHVETSAAAGCLEVDHDHGDPAALIQLLRGWLHGWQVADNGEVVMTITDPTLTQECSMHPTHQDERR
jgi:hypothetical protein